MPFIPVANTAEVELVYDFWGITAENTLYFRKPSPWDAADLTNLAQKVNDWFTVNLSSELSNELHLVRIVATSLQTVSSPQVVNTEDMPIDGGIAGPSLPGNVALVVTFNTEIRGRSYRGRNYILGIPESQAAGNAVEPTYAANLQLDYEQLGAQMTAEGYEHVVVSRYSGVDVDGNPIPRLNGVTTPVTSYFVNTDLDSQRRRLNGRGS